MGRGFLAMCPYIYDPRITTIHANPLSASPPRNTDFPVICISNTITHTHTHTPSIRNGSSQGDGRVRGQSREREAQALTDRSVPQEFIKEGLQFVNRCTKPDKVRSYSCAVPIVC
jgi:hypothetical protein